MTPPAMLFQVHDVLSAFDALTYELHAFVARKVNRIDIRPNLRRVAIASIGIAMQVAIEAGQDVEKIRAMERELIAYVEAS